MPITMEVFEGKAGFVYCDCFDSNCHSCGSSYKSGLSGAGASLGVKAVKLGAHDITCGGSRATVYYLPAGSYTYERESTACVFTPSCANKKHFHTGRAFAVTSREVEEGCDVVSLHICSSSIQNVTDWIKDHCN